MNPIISIGGLHFGTLLNQAEAADLLYRAIDNGIDLIDTAPIYGAGNSEKIIGTSLARISTPPRIATKVGLLSSTNKLGQFSVKIDRLIKENIVSSVDRSLKNLKVERIDLLTLHAFDSLTPIEETVSILNGLVKEGKVKSVGCSNFNPSQLKILIDCCRNTSTPLQSAQVHYNLIERRAESKFIKLCEKNNLQIHINRALARGALSSKYLKGVPYESRAHSSPRIKKWLNNERLDIILQLNLICKKYNFSLVEASIMWFNNKNYDKRLIIGARNPIQFMESLLASRLKVNLNLIDEIDSYLNFYNSIYSSPTRYLER